MKRKISAGLLPAVLVVLAAGPAAAAPAERKDEPGIAAKAVRTIDDVAVTNAIRAEFARDKLVSAREISVETKEGIVTLTGKVRTKAEADRAVAIAKDRKNVIRVENRIEVTPEARR
jgi:hyperosmotically inducible periplasmic protein